MSTNNIAAYILAGGESRRFNKKIKGLQLLNNKPLIEHIIDTLALQATEIYINSHIQEYTCFNLPMLPDENALYQGPLSGLHASMIHMCTQTKFDWLFIAPCDTPFIPDNIIASLYASLTNKQAACIRYQNELQPTFSIWHKSILPLLETAVCKKQWKSLKKFIYSLDEKINIIDYPESSKTTVNPFLNINSPQDLQIAEGIKNA